ncbi:hypothetical protein DN748_12175 [Sinomicrobium soli]|nr:hypothetical protein DN748_12175 [Sinomicrobium sp. N-1-3-6]
MNKILLYKSVSTGTSYYRADLEILRLMYRNIFVQGPVVTMQHDKNSYFCVSANPLTFSTDDEEHCF